MDRAKCVLSEAPPLRNAGMTLLEASFATAMVSVIFLVMFTTLLNQSKITVEQLAEIDLQSTLRRTATDLSNELSDAHLVWLDSYARWVEYNKPKVGTSGAPQLDPVSGKTIWGVTDFNGTWHAGGYYHLAFVDDPPVAPMTSSAITVSEAAWGQDIDLDGNMTSTLTFQPGSIQLWVCDGTSPGQLNTDGTPKGAYPGSRIVTVSCFRDATPRLASPWNTGEGIFYMRQKRANGPLQRANSYTDSGVTGGPSSWIGDGKYEYGEPVSPDIYSNGRYFEADSDPFTDTNNNNILDGTETPPVPGKYNHNIRLVLIALAGGKRQDQTSRSSQNGLGLGGTAEGGTENGVKRVIFAQTLVKLHN